MKDSELFNKFNERLKQAKEGILYQYDVWLKEKGINQSFFSVKDVKRYFYSHPDKTIGFEGYLEIIAEYVKKVS